ncbi:extracellular solute-binding protein [Ruminococcaceae bacterium OttesenSCG-928-L11]|nr:extracellular solute-binding protein [Ruminococcaceae bacterium OttesenSCG-928-L11]
MKSFWNKATCILVMAAIVLGTTACGGGTGSSAPASSAAAPAASSNASSAPAASAPAEDGKSYKFTFYRNGAWPTYPADGGSGYQVMKDAMKAYGLPDIDWEVVAIGGTEYYDKINVLAASNSLPDAMNVNMVTLTSFADQGLIIPLEDKLDQLPAVKDLMRPSELEAVTYKDHLYAFPVGYLEGSINGPNTDGLIIRQDWLDKVGMEVPGTIDEMYAVMKAFKEQDPDGNGQNDTYGYLGTKTTLFQDIFGAYGIQPSFWMETPDGLRLGSTLPATKDALQVLQTWYAEGLIDPDIFTTDKALKDQNFANSKGGIYEGYGFTGSPVQPETAALLSVTPTAKLSPVGKLVGPNGDYGRQESAPGYGNIRSISANCKDVDVLMQMLNWSVDQAENGGFYLCSVGEEGIDFTLEDGGKKINQVSTYDDIYAKGLGNPVRFLQVVDRRWLVDEAVACFEAFSDNYRENKCWKTTPSMLDYPDTCENLFKEYLAKIVLGNLPVDAWDNYVKDFYAMGGDKIEQEVNEIVKAG